MLILIMTMELLVDLAVRLDQAVRIVQDLSEDFLWKLYCFISKT